MLGRLGLNIAMSVFAVLEELNKLLQARNATVSGMLQAVSTVRMQLCQFRSNDKLLDILDTVNDTISKLDLKPIGVQSH